MQRNLQSSGGLFHSQRVLLALVEAGCTREEAYARVQLSSSSETPSSSSSCKTNVGSRK